MLIVGISSGILGLTIGVLLGGFWMAHKYCLKLMECRKTEEKNHAIIRMYDVWMMAKQYGKISMEDYLTGRQIHSIAIYGMDYKGIRLFHELKNTSIHVVCGLDRNPPMKIKGLSIFQPDHIKDEDVDAVIVTAVCSFDEIKRDLEKKTKTKIIALDELLYALI